MKRQSAYIFLTLEEKNGEYEFFHKIAHEVSDKRKATADKFADNYAKTFFGVKPEKESGGYYFHGRESFVSVKSWKFISREQFNVLREFL